MNALQQWLVDVHSRVAWTPDWAVALLVFAVAAALALLTNRLLARTLNYIVKDRDLLWRSLVSRTTTTLRLGLVLVFLSFASTIAPLSDAQAGLVQHALSLGIIALAVIVARTALHIWTTVYLRRFKLDAEDNLLARKHVTQSRILERIAVTLLIIIGIAAGLMTFNGVAQYGLSLLASAGAAGIVAGLALQPLLKNIFAGLQLAITQPIRIDDALLVEGEWGNVEEITSTYVVLRLWDWRRLILPLSYFIENPFQNWTREGAALIGTVMLYLDHSVPVEALRGKAQEIAEASPLWDHRVVAVQVTDFKEFTMEIRILISARNASRTFDLRCEMREKLIAFVQTNYPGALPRHRADISTPGGIAVTSPVRSQEMPSF